MGKNVENIIDTVAKILEKYPLCDRCLGRLFAHLGKGLGNNERGKALKIAAILDLHRRVLSGDSKSLDILRKVVLNSKLNFKDFFKELGMDYPQAFPSCYICGDQLDNIIITFSETVAKLVKEKNVRSFLIGVIIAGDVLERESNIVKEYHIPYWESIKREIKREIGKRVQSLTNIKVDFENPHVTYIIDLINNTVKEEIRSLFLYGKYRKLGRLISQNVWIRKSGERRYHLSVEDVVKHSLSYVKASDVVLHIGGREDVDVRVLSGRPLVIEYKSPQNSNINIESLNKVLNSFTPWIQFEMEMKVRREFVSRLKGPGSLTYKIYRALIYSQQEVEPEKLHMLEEFFNNRMIVQRTPTRILRRKPDRLRNKVVYQVKTLYISPHVFAAIIKCDGGLYVKELITGDGGRTTPSFSSYLNTELQCLMLDVIYVHEYI